MEELIMDEKAIPLSQLKQAVREVLAEMLGLEFQIQAHTNRQWYDTDPAYQLLGLDDPEQLREAVRSGLLRVGHEVRDRRKPQAKLPRYQFHIENCQKRLSERPERRLAG
ncbi:MAG: hypothetical protein HC833_05675 [Leptolyngbyaceae cyanobacterium RM1_406_9]|nr:hypothetical protein [Leptolyngbyaceae cyanobacterium RM1_406_9]